MEPSDGRRPHREPIGVGVQVWAQRCVDGHRERVESVRWPGHNRLL
jgi:hypothetical protein